MLQPQALGLPAFFADVFNNTVQNNILLIDTKGIILAINPAFTNFFGHQPEDIVGKNISILFTPEDREKGLPEKELGSVLSTGQGSDNNYLVAADNSKIWVSGELSQNLADGRRVVAVVAGVAHDLSCRSS